MSQAYACRIVPENFPAISSEKPNFDLEELRKWLIDHDAGYFIRDDISPWDCTYMDFDIFRSVYRFESFKYDELFHPIKVKI